MRSWRRRAAIGVLVAAVGLPLIGHWLRQARLERCALDGAAIEPVYAVRVVGGDGRSHRLCCIRCAEFWLTQEVRPTAVYVTDEATGREVDASLAWYVSSAVVTTRMTGNRIHAFAQRQHAERHAKANHGRVLSDSRIPLQLKEQPARKRS